MDLVAQVVVVTTSQLYKGHGSFVIDHELQETYVELFRRVLEEEGAWESATHGEASWLQRYHRCYAAC